MSIAFTVVATGEAASERLVDLDLEEVLVGRDEAADVRLPHESVSGIHLRLVRNKGRLWVVDGGSTNGTLLDGSPLPPHRAVALEQGARLSLGPFELHIGRRPQSPPVATSAASPADAPDTAQLARQMVLQLMGQPAQQRSPCLLVLNGPQAGQPLQLPPEGTVVVGRGQECGLRLDDADASRRHLVLWCDAGRVELSDLQSKNGALVNGQRLSGRAHLLHGDVVQVGQTRLRLVDPAGQLLRRVDQRGPVAQAAPHDVDGEVADGPASPEPDESPASEPGHSLAVARIGSDVAPRPVSADVARGRRAGSLQAHLVPVLVGGAVVAAIGGAIWLLL